MFGLFKRLLGKDPNKSSSPSSSAGQSRPSYFTAGTSPSSQNVSTHTSSMTQRTFTSSNSGPQEPELFWPERSVRWDNKYDVYICHSEHDLPFAKEMLYYLEGLPERLRCFLPLRDMDAGGAMVSEMCHGLGNSHCWVMLLTTCFLDDSWCKYQMHQALMKAPGGEGRFIPLMIDLPRSRYPMELSFLCYIRGTSGDHQVFAQLRKCILMYLKKMQNVMSDKVAVPSSESTVRESDAPGSDMGGPSSDSSMRYPETQGPSSDSSMRSPEPQGPSSDSSMRSPEPQEPSSDSSMRSPEPQGPSSDSSMRYPEAQGPSSDSSKRYPETQGPSSDSSMRYPEAQVPSSDSSMRSPEAQGPSSDSLLRFGELRDNAQ